MYVSSTTKDTTKTIRFYFHIFSIINYNISDATMMWLILFVQHEIGQFLGSILTVKSGSIDQSLMENGTVGDTRKKRKRKLGADSTEGTSKASSSSRGTSLVSTLQIFCR
jgi:hypothetical protein